jgi:hypothetical protein
MEPYLRDSCPEEGAELDINKGSRLNVSGHHNFFLNRITFKSVLSLERRLQDHVLDVLGSHF